MGQGFFKACSSGPAGLWTSRWTTCGYGGQACGWAVDDRWSAL